MLDRLVPNFRPLRIELETLAPAGFVLAYSVYHFTPEAYYTTFPDAWREIYTTNGYANFDPVLYWGLTHTGAIRWSEISLLGRKAVAGRVMTRAREHGLVYGAFCVARSPQTGRKSFLSLARSDREFDDDEVARGLCLVQEVVHQIEAAPTLSEEEVIILELLAQGHTVDQVATKRSTPLRTVKRRLETARSKLQALNNTQAIALAVERRLIQPYGSLP